MSKNVVLQIVLSAPRLMSLTNSPSDCSLGSKPPANCRRIHCNSSPTSRHGARFTSWLESVESARHYAELRRSLDEGGRFKNFDKNGGGK